MESLTTAQTFMFQNQIQWVVIHKQRIKVKTMKTNRTLQLHLQLHR